MSCRIERLPKAREDMIEQYVYIGLDNAGAAARFKEATEAAIQKLAEFPGMGSPRPEISARHKDLRVWPIPGGIEVVRVLYAARNAEPLLEDRG